MQCDIDDNDIDLRHYWQMIRGGGKIIGGIVGVVTGIAIIVSLLLPEIYVATAVIMPVGASGGGGLSALAGQLGGLGSLAGIGGAPSVAQQFMTLLKSRTLAEQVIVTNNLIPALFPDTPVKPLPSDEDVSGYLQQHVRFVEDKKDMRSNSIEISAEFKDPKLAALVANAYVDGLQRFINANALTVSKRNRLFIGEQLEENKRDLLIEGKKLSDFYKGSGVSGSAPYVDVPIVGSVDLKLTTPLVVNNLGSDVDFNEGQKPGLEQLQDQKKALESTLKGVSTTQRIEGEASGNTPPKLGVVSEDWIVRNVPQQVYLQYLTLHRGLLTQINGLLTQQYEMAKINEKKDELAFQLVDAARAPGHRSSPKRSRIVLFAFLVSTMVSVVVVFCVDFIKKNWKSHRNEV